VNIKNQCLDNRIQNIQSRDLDPRQCWIIDFLPINPVGYINIISTSAVDSLTITVCAVIVATFYEGSELDSSKGDGEVFHHFVDFRAAAGLFVGELWGN